MIQVMPGTKVYLACRPVSMRYGFDGLAAQVKQVLAADPFSGHLFLFRSMAMVKTVARATSLPQTKNRGQRLTLTQQPFPLPQVGAQRSHFGLWPEAGAAANRIREGVAAIARRRRRSSAQARAWRPVH